MVSSQKHLDYVLEQLNGLEEITYRKMMGEYILYYQGKIVGGIYDDIIETNRDKEGNELEKVRSIFEGKNKDFVTAVDEKNIIVVKEVDDSSFIKGLFKVMVDELSMTKKKK